MRKGELSKLVSVVGRIVLTFLFVFSQSTWAAQDQKTKAAANSTQKVAAQQTGEKQSSAAPTAKAQAEKRQREASETAVAEERSSREGSHEGVKVHGHWTIEVRNPDGTLVTHREFENSLAPAQFGGPAVISAFLARKATVGGWNIFIVGNNGGPCMVNGNPNSCTIREPNLGGPTGSFFSDTLGVTADTNSHLVLSGQVTAAFNDAIYLVQTDVNECAATVTPAATCQYTNNTYQFTSATASASNPGFSSPVPVLAGQTIAVTVVISFS